VQKCILFYNVPPDEQQTEHGPVTRFPIYVRATSPENKIQEIFIQLSQQRH
jgi:hypothetical protein